MGRTEVVFEDLLQYLSYQNTGDNEAFAIAYRDGRTSLEMAEICVDKVKVIYKSKKI